MNYLPAALLAALALLSSSPDASARTKTTLTRDWRFAKVDSLGNRSEWQSVRVPHDWAIHEPFSRDNDLQVVAVEQNGETEKTVKTGRTGGLPYMGRGVYETQFEVADTAGRVFTFLFDGAMSNPSVEVNGRNIGGWAYGYNSFSLPVPAGLLKPGANTLKVSLENKPQSSRWYPGAGLYRNVHLISTSRIHIPVWGTHLTTPTVNRSEAAVRLEMQIEGASKGEKVMVETEIVDPSGKVVALNSAPYFSHGQSFTQDFYVKNPQLWSPESPNLYEARTRLKTEGETLDEYVTRFGIRSLEFIPTKGFFLNGEYTKLKGVCNHHDLGPLGAAVNRAALRHQIELLQGMGCNAIRTSHNMPAPELAELCDEMGMMLMVEPFDDWGFRPKSPNGYGSIFNEWAEKDMINMLHQYRNHPSVVMWSIGNEVPSQWGPDGLQELTMLQDICHREDPTRPVTCGMDQIGAVLDNGFAAALDIPGFNYKPQHYLRAYDLLPQKLIVGSETASLVSSRGKYMFPMEIGANVMHPDNQCSSYGTEYCYWSNVPDLDFAADDDYPWLIGQFVWTGFDYLGEPSPYDTDAWPSHSSVFGIFDLASLPKDVYYLYRSQWKKDSPTLHILPHWNWTGREGQTTPVMVYTSYPEAELFVNGVSHGRRKKDLSQQASQVRPGYQWPSDYTSEQRAEDAANLMDRYRLVWEDVVYQPGEVKVVAYDASGAAVDTAKVETTGSANRLVLTPNKTVLTADGEDLVYITVQAVDKEGRPVPTSDALVKFDVKGDGEFLATANGDATCLLPMDQPEMKLFSGAATLIVRAGDKAGSALVKATSKGLKPATLTLEVKE